LRRGEVAAIFKIRDTALEAAREYLRSKKFLEVQTPRIISTSSEGGTDLFPVAYFEKEAFLAQSPQLYKQMLIMGTGFDRVYEIATYFRAEEHDTIWHLNEVTAVDCEVAFIEDEGDVLVVIENLVASMINAVREKCKKQLEILGRELKEPKLPFTRVTYDDAVKMIDESGLKLLPKKSLVR